MTGSLSSFGTALSALRYQRLAMDVASNNIANASTAGYTRRRAEAQALGAPVTPALWSRSVGVDGMEGGVRSAGVTRLADPLLDVRARREHGVATYLGTRAAVLGRVETAVGEPGDSGVAAALTDFRKAWQDLANDPGGDAARGQVLSRGAALADAVRGQAAQLAAEGADQRVRLDAVVAEVNAVAGDLAAVNQSLAVAHTDGSDAADLLDQRDGLALRLAELTGAVSTARPDGGFDVTVGGVALVDGVRAATFTVSGTGPATSFAAADGATTTAVLGVGGEAGAVGELLTTTLPAYAAGLGTVAEMLADALNAQHEQGFDRAGAAGGPLFSYTPGDAAATLTLAVTDRAEVAASGLPGGVLDGSNALDLGQPTAAETAYQRLVAGLGTEVASTQRRATTQQLLTTQVDSAREQLSGVNIDEETVNLLAAQRSYEAAARVLNVVDSVLDTLINRTGLTR